MPSYRLIVGLGNPGSKYEGTRHNLGFAALDAVLSPAAFSPESRGPVEVAREGDVRFLKPQTYMNLSGPAVAAWLSWLKLTPADLLVLVDDFALPFGEIRFRTGGSHGGHNGLRSIEETLGTRDYARLRLGMGPVPERWAVEDFVLARFTPEEKAQLPLFLDRAKDAFRCCQDRGISLAMTLFNKKQEL
ncbi:MAG: aminoacyl-tRNA hydrolase [Verrucomicrobium sp.]|nr:aminoacyl-tRNA hydrolase [Verrucomicrobium sp.]